MRRRIELLWSEKSLSHTCSVTTMSVHTMSVIFIDWGKEPASGSHRESDGN